MSARASFIQQLSLWAGHPKFRLQPAARVRAEAKGFYGFFGRFPVLETERLRLRELKDEDAAGLLALLADPEVMRYLRVPWRPPQNLDECKTSLGRLRKRFYDETFVIPWVITYRADDRLIGNIRYFSFCGHAGMIGEVAYELSRRHWGRGIMTEALGAVVEFGFGAIGLNRVQLTVHPQNVASLRVAAKAGFTREGLLRHWCYDSGSDQWDDVVMFSILRADRPATKST